MIAFVDEFIVYDDMQYTKRDWRNRNRIKTSQGLQWLTVPVQVKGRFTEIAEWLAPIYLEEEHVNLSSLNRRLLEPICDYLGINTFLTNSWDYELADGKSERLANLCQQAAATEYVSGPAARSYVDEAIFEATGIKVTWFDYEGYPHYRQLWGSFEPGETILDLLFNVGAEAPHYLRHCHR
jgi:hypothetical protein